MLPLTTPEQSRQTFAANIQVMSYKEFFALCISGPVSALAVMATYTYFPKTVSPDFAGGMVFALQGLIALKFMLKQNPKLNADVLEATSGRYNMYTIRSLVVAATTVGSFILLVLPLYAIFKFPFP